MLAERFPSHSDYGQLLDILSDARQNLFVCRSLYRIKRTQSRPKQLEIISTTQLRACISGKVDRLSRNSKL